MGESLTALIPTLFNPSDLCTKSISGVRKRKNISGLVLYDIVN